MFIDGRFWQSWEALGVDFASLREEDGGIPLREIRDALSEAGFARLAEAKTIGELREETRGPLWKRRGCCRSSFGSCAA